MKQKSPTADHVMVKRRRLHESKYSKELFRLVDNYKFAQDVVSAAEIRRAIGYGELLSDKQLNALAQVYKWSAEDKALMLQLRDERKLQLEQDWFSGPIATPSDGSNSQILRERTATEYGSRPEIIDQSEVLQKHQSYFGNKGMLERIRDFCLADDGVGRYFLIEGKPLSGKSALACELVRNLPDRAAYFFIQQQKGDWGDSKAIFGSLAAQIVKKYELPDAVLKATESASSIFFQALRLAAGSPEAAGETIVVVIDGLDKAFGSLREGSDATSFMPFEVPPPKNCRIVVTSRPGKHLHQLKNIDCCDAAQLEAGQKEQIKRWIVEENRVRNLALDNKLVAGLTESAQGVFGVPVWLLRERAGLREDLHKWKDNLDELPQGLDGLLNLEWERLVRTCERRGIAETDCRHLLGLLALAGKPLNWGTLRAMLLGFGRLGDHGSIAGLDIKDAVRIINPSRLLERFEQVFDCSREYFEVEPPERKERQLDFFHDFFAEFLESLLDRFAERDFANQLLAGICAERRDQALKDYAIRYRFAHILDLQQWQTALAFAFADEEFVIASLKKRRASEFHGNAVLAAQKSAEGDPVLNSTWMAEYEEFALFLRRRLWGLTVSSESYRQEVANEFIGPSGASDSRKSGGLRKVLESEMVSAPWHTDLFVRKKKGGPALRSHGHRGAVDAVAFYPQHSRLATGGADGVIKIWDFDSGRLIADLIGHTRSVNSVAWSRDGSVLASASTDGTVRLWDAGSGGQILKFEPVHEEKIGAPVVDHQSGFPFVFIYGGQFEPVNAVAISSDGKTLASGDADGAVRLWSVEARKHLQTGRGHSSEVLDLAFASESNLLASASADGTLRLWSSVNLAPLAVSTPQAEAPSHIAFCSDGETIVSRSEGKPLRFWTRRNGGLFVVSQKVIPGVRALPFAKEFMRFLKKKGDGVLTVKNVAVGRDYSIGQPEARSLSGDGSRLVEAAGGRPLKVLNSITGKLILQSSRKQSNVIKLESSWNGRRVAVIDDQNRSRIWDGEKDSILAESPNLTRGEVVHIFSRDGKKLARGTNEGDLSVWDYIKNKEVRMDTGKWDERSSLSCVAFSPKGDWICAGDVHGKIGLWHAGNGLALTKTPMPEADVYGGVQAVVVSHCGTMVGSLFQNGAAKVWKFERTISVGSGIEAEDMPFDRLNECRTSPPLEQTRLPTKVVRSEHAVVTISKSVPKSIAALSFSPDGKYLLVAHNETVRIWDWQADKRSVLFLSCAVQGVAFEGAKQTDFLVLDAEGQVFAYEIVSESNSAV